MPLHLSKYLLTKAIFCQTFGGKRQNAKINLVEIAVLRILVA